MSQAVTVPDTLEMMVGEQLNLSIDFTNLIAVGDVISAPTVTVTNNSTDETIPTAIIGSPSVSGSAIILVTVNSTNLRKKNTYIMLLSCVATGGGSTKTVSAQLTVKIIF